VFWDW